jgi:hypothetical protein
MIMIFVVIMVAAATTIVAASVDLGRMATYKQKQSEREAKWQYCLDSAKALVVEDMVGLVGTSQSFAKSINGVNLTVTSEVDGSWNPVTGGKITTTGTLDGKIRTSLQYVGKRATVQPCQFGMLFTDKFQPDANTILNADIYLPGNLDASGLTITGDIYSPNVSAPIVASQTGSFFGRQPGQHIVLNDSLYAAQATVTTSGTSTLNNPTNLSLGTHSQLRYHTGNLTISGSTLGEITIYVKGSVNIANVRNSIGRLVVICNGDAQIAKGTSDVFLICNGKVSSSGGGGAGRIVNGSLAGAEFSNTAKDYTVNFDNYFVSNTNGGNRYWIPGQW